MFNGPKLVQYFGYNVDQIDYLYAVNGKGIIVVLTSLKRIVIWKPDVNGKYVSILSNILPARASCMEYQSYSNKAKLYIAQYDGQIGIICLTEKMDHILEFKFIQAHKPNSRITCVKILPGIKALFSVGSDNVLSWVDLNSQDNYYKFPTLLQNSSMIKIDQTKNIMYILSDQKEIQCFEICPNDIIKLKTLANISHDNSKIITYMSFIDKYKSLVVGCKSGEILVYANNVEKNDNFLLHNHRSEIIFIELVSKNLLLSLSMDGILVIWDFSAHYLPVQSWKMKDECAICSIPFFWNIKSILSNKKMGSRRHHCRICGDSFCNDHCSIEATSPSHGLELPSRMCKQCYSYCSTKPTASHCVTYKLKSSPEISAMDFTSRQLFIAPRKTPIQHLDLRETISRITF